MTKCLQKTEKSKRFEGSERKVFLFVKSDKRYE